MKVDYLIIGQGLAGSALAMALLDEGASVFVIDSEDENSASRVAAGLLTTLAGKGMNPGWRQAEYLPEALAYYRKLEEISGKVLFYPKKVLRLLDDERQRMKFLTTKREEHAYWIADAMVDDCSKWKADFGGFVMRHGGWLDTKLYLQVVRDVLEDYYRKDVFNDVDFCIHGDGVSWKDVEARKVILCQGARGLTEGGYFSYLSHRCAKGEILTISMPEADTSRILSRNGWLVPVYDNFWRAGATYEWKDMAGNTSQAGREEIEKKIRAFTDVPFQVIDHQAGVRPILRNSQPFVGYYPDAPRICFFNGLGSKGVTTAPSVARHFAKHLVSDVNLDVCLRL